MVKFIMTAGGVSLFYLLTAGLFDLMRLARNNVVIFFLKLISVMLIKIILW